MWCTSGEPGSGSTATTLIFAPAASGAARRSRSDSRKDWHHTSVFPDRNSSCTPGARRAAEISAVVSGKDATSMRTSTGTAWGGSVGMDARESSRSFCFATSYVAEGGAGSGSGGTAAPGSDAPARLGVPDPSRDTSCNTPGDALPPARAGTARPTARSATMSARKRVVCALR
jgi:hypothetical protein